MTDALDSTSTSVQNFAAITGKVTEG